MGILSVELPFLLNPADVLLALGQLQELARRVCRGVSGIGGSAEGGRATLRERLHVLRILSHVALAAGHGAAAVREIQAAAAVCAEDWVGEDGGTAPARALFHSTLGRHHITEGDVGAAAAAFDLARACGLQEGSTAALLDKAFSIWPVATTQQQARPSLRPRWRHVLAQRTRCQRHRLMPKKLLLQRTIWLSADSTQGSYVRRSKALRPLPSATLWLSSGAA